MQYTIKKRITYTLTVSIADTTITIPWGSCQNPKKEEVVNALANYVSEIRPYAELDDTVEYDVYEEMSNVSGTLSRIVSISIPKENEKLIEMISEDYAAKGMLKAVFTALI